MGGSDFIIFQDLLGHLASFLCFLIFDWGEWNFLVLILGARMLSSFSCVWLFVTSWTVALRGILQARILEWVAISLSRGSSRPRDWIHVSCIAGGSFICWATGEALILGSSLIITCFTKISQFWL